MDSSIFATGKKPIHSKWVYKIKYKSDESIELYKFGLVICRSRQIEGINYHDTFTLVAKLVTVRTILAIAASHHWQLYQLNVDNAFLHGDLHEEVYMHLPPGYHTSMTGKACFVYAPFISLYALQCWFSKLTGALKAYGFSQSYVDYSLFTL
ncbi:unnamed protein product [Cuscuta europaea]|uniref:Reverse transcriptase Ty1/copia-type domain-containing protein n=1 Tax=Cuscuta europaea TaxID=41803 RepID=A0A9P0ZWC6_CUSEU|nr:unnamed protein product [Cuscuta europaea]